MRVQDSVAASQPACDTLAAFTTGLHVGSLPQGVREAAKLHLLDALGIALAAGTLPTSVGLLDTLTRWGGAPESTLIGRKGERLAAPTAALANGALMHSLDFDDTHPDAIVHASAVVAPAALAAAEAVHADGGTLLAAFVGGIEVAVRVGLARPSGFHARGFHATPICGAVGAAAAAARAMGLDARQTSRALGLAASTGAGLQNFLLGDGTRVKSLHAGWAAHAGVVTAALAKAGWEGPRTALEGRFGLLDAHLGPGEFDAGALTADVGRRWETVRLAFKPYPCCHFLHGSIDAAHALRTAGLHAGEIERVECRVPPPVVEIVCEPAARKRAPDTPYAAMFSLQYAVAVALVDGTAGLAQFGAERIQDPVVRALAERIEYVPDASLEFPRYYPGHLRVTRKDGRQVDQFERINRGHPDRPLSPQEVVAKFEANTHARVGPERSRAIVERVETLETLEDASVLGDLLA